MTDVSLDHALQALLDAITYPKAEGQAPPTVALTFDTGSGGEAIAARLADELHVRVYDRDLLHQLAERTGMDTALLERIENHVRPRWNEWLHLLHQQHSSSKAAYFRQLVSILLGLLEHGGVVIGRGAHLILAHHPVFRVRIVGSVQHRAQRIANERHLPFTEAREVAMEDRRHSAMFLNDYFHQHRHHASHFDLVINTDKLRDPAGCAGLILAGMRLAGISLGGRSESHHA